MYYVYMLRCTDNSIYTGLTKDITRRMKEHFNKTEKCAKYTINHGAKKLEAVWRTENRKLAAKLEFYIKQLGKLKKEELIEKNNINEIFNFRIDETQYIREKLTNIIEMNCCK